jgi:hypothetical protein
MLFDDEDDLNNCIDDDDVYLKALAAMNAHDFDEKQWLVHFFELYKTTLNWPNNLPPISRTNLVKGTFRERVNSIYYEYLSEYDHLLDNKTQTFRLI